MPTQTSSRSDVDMYAQRHHLATVYRRRQQQRCEEPIGKKVSQFNYSVGFFTTFSKSAVANVQIHRLYEAATCS